MAYHLNVKIDEELERALRMHCEENDLSMSTVVRDLLRSALGLVGSRREAGWREGYTAAIGEVHKTIGEALRGLMIGS